MLDRWCPERKWLQGMVPVNPVDDAYLGSIWVNLGLSGPIRSPTKAYQWVGILARTSRGVTRLELLRWQAGMQAGPSPRQCDSHDNHPVSH